MFMQRCYIYVKKPLFDLRYAKKKVLERGINSLLKGGA